MEISCKTCIHKKVCDLWREQECQSAKSFFDDECKLYAAEPDNDIIHLQKEQAYLQGWEEGRKALKKVVIEALCNHYEVNNAVQNATMDECVMLVKNIPPAEPKTGKWIPVSVSSGRDSWECSVCGRRARGKTKNLPYCHCGAKMEVSE